jgi:hypothetical protein
MTKTIEETIEAAKKVMAAHNLPFATIWKTNNKHYGFNFKEHEVGFIYKEYGVKSVVVHILKK